MTNIEAVREWLKTYKPLSGGRLNIDCLPMEAQTYSVDSVPCKPIVKQYMDGSSVRCFEFVLASRDFMTEEIQQNADNLAFYENFSQWVGTQNRHRSLPVMGDGRTPRKVEVTTTGYPFLVDQHGTARYQIQMKLTYFQKGER